MKKKNLFSSLLIVICAIVLGYGLSWAVVVGFIELISICFGWTITLAQETGIWLVLCLAYLLTYHHRKEKKK